MGIIPIQSNVRLWFLLTGQDNLAVVEPECPSQVANDASKGDFSKQSSKLQEKDCSFTNQSESDVDNTKTVNAVDIPGITIIGEPVPQLPIYDKHIYVNEDPLIYGNEPHIYGNEDPLEKPISVSQLALYIDDMSNRRNGFAEEFAVSVLGRLLLTWINVNPSMDK